MPKLNLVKMQGGLFRCATQQDYELAKRFKVDETVLFDAKVPRNARFHRKCFALLNFVFKNQSKYGNFEAMRDAFCLQAGHFEWQVSFSGKQYPRAKSMAYDAMDDAEFSVLYDKFIDIALQQFGDDMEEWKLRQYVEGVIGFA